VCGGIATVKRVEHKPTPANPVNSYFVYFENLSRGFNLTILLEDQEQLEQTYGTRLAHDCPDIPGHVCPDPHKFDPDTFQYVGITRISR
jgi:hypothetical protein